MNRGDSGTGEQSDWRQQYPTWAQVGRVEPIPFGEALPQDEMDFLNQCGFTFEDDSLGKGGFATVWKVRTARAIKDEHGNYVEATLACKVLSISRFKQQTVDKSVHELLQEGHVHQQLTHPNVVKCEHVFYLKQQSTGFPYMRALIFMELCDGDLVKLMSTRVKREEEKRLSEEETHEWFVQICEGLQYLHDLNVVHFDIKISNVVYKGDENNVLVFKLADFGLSQIYASEDRDPVDRRQRGTRKYFAPELAGHSLTVPDYKSKPVDIYGLGMCVAESVGGKASIRDVIQGARFWTGAVKKTLGFGIVMADIILKMTNTDPNKRPTIREVKQHQWFSMYGKR